MQEFERNLYANCPECRAWFGSPLDPKDCEESKAGASLYTDGLLQVPNESDLSFGICSGCNSVSSYLDWGGYMLDDQDWIHGKFVSLIPATFTQAFQFCEQESRSGVGVYPLALMRFYLWQLGNDVRRTGQADLPLSPDEELNLLKFIGLTHHKPNFAICTGMVLRALGRFDESIRILEECEKDSKMDRLLANKNIELAITLSPQLGTVWFGDN